MATRNEYRAYMEEARLAWLEREYNALHESGRVSNAIHNWIVKEGGVRGLKPDYLDSFGDLICRTKEKLRA